MAPPEPSFVGTPSPPSILEVALMSNHAEKHWKQIDPAPVVSFRGFPPGSGHSANAPVWPFIF